MTYRRHRAPITKSIISLVAHLKKTPFVNIHDWLCHLKEDFEKKYIGDIISESDSEINNNDKDDESDDESDKSDKSKNKEKEDSDTLFQIKN